MMIDYFGSARLKELSEKLDALDAERSKYCIKSSDNIKAIGETKGEYNKEYTIARSNYWMAHGGILGKCFKFKDDKYGKTHYYRVHGVINNRFHIDSWGLIIEHIVWLDKEPYPHFYMFYTSWVQQSDCTPEREIPLDAWEEVRKTFFVWKNKQEKTNTVDNGTDND